MPTLDKVACTSLTLVLGVLVGLTGCSQFTVEVDRNPDVDFARYRTFAWMPIAEAPPVDQSTGDRGIDNRIYAGVEKELNQRGYEPADGAKADLLVTFRLLRTDALDDAHVAYGTQWRRGAYLEAMHGSTDTYERGSLIVDVVDRARNELVWRGIVSARLLGQVSYQKRRARADAAVAQMFEKFPVRRG